MTKKKERSRPQHSVADDLPDIMVVPPDSETAGGGRDALIEALARLLLAQCVDTVPADDHAGAEDNT